METDRFFQKVLITNWIYRLLIKALCPHIIVNYASKFKPDKLLMFANKHYVYASMIFYLINCIQEFLAYIRLRNSKLFADSHENN